MSLPTFSTQSELFSTVGLSRLECVRETMRLALQELERGDRVGAGSARTHPRVRSPLHAVQPSQFQCGRLGPTAQEAGRYEQYLRAQVEELITRRMRGSS